jgi:hypothetical protein
MGDIFASNGSKMKTERTRRVLPFEFSTGHSAGGVKEGGAHVEGDVCMSGVRRVPQKVEVLKADAESGRIRTGRRPLAPRRNETS